TRLSSQLIFSLRMQKSGRPVAGFRPSALVSAITNTWPGQEGGGWARMTGDFQHHPRVTYLRKWVPAGVASAAWVAIGVTSLPLMIGPLSPSSLLNPLISSAAMRALLDDRARLQRMLDFEAALARAEAALGIVPALASDQIAAAARAE